MTILKKSITTALAIAIAILLNACSSTGTQTASTSSPQDFAKRLQEDLIKAKPGSVIEIPAGKFQFDKTLSLNVSKVTIRGKGMKETILSFTGQKAGSAGLMVKADDFVIEDLAIEDAAGDALKVENSSNVTMRRVRVEWTGGPKETNGPYGLYPVTCKNVLIEDCVAIAASDAGIYVGQSDGVIMRRNRAEKNVAGIEIENTKNADVYENIATNNTGGIMAFNLPDLPVQGGTNVRIYNNKIMGNNLPNFAPTSQIVAGLPTGTGVLVMSIKNVEVFKNVIQDNNTANINISTFSGKEGELPDLSKYNPFVASVYIHDNEISGGGTKPDVRLPKIAALAKATGGKFTDILYDGVIEPIDVSNYGKPAEGADAKICIENNGAATFLNYDAGNGSKKIVKDVNAYKCSLPALAAINLPNAGGKSGGGL
ncbi:MAG: right-handed parallel beta-helix repeat-containing protein [Blastocatellia bacterium]|nr:right-handed parallel beta-helix repeat-containing protein [Blastocatellia bacterium]